METILMGMHTRISPGRAGQHDPFLQQDLQGPFDLRLYGMGIPLYLVPAVMSS